MDLLESGLFASFCLHLINVLRKQISQETYVFLFRKLYQVSVNAKVRAVRSESKTVLVDAHARGKNLLCGNDDQQLSREDAVAARFIASIKFCPKPRLEYSAF